MFKLKPIGSVEWTLTDLPMRHARVMKARPTPLSDSRVASDRLEAS
jgi:hypothetical protein